MEHYYIYCLHNEDLPEYYVGHTTNLKDRNKTHKWSSNNCNSKVYKYIRDNDGYNNFKMEVLYETYCDLEEAIKLERYYIELLGATLNSDVPGRTVTEWANQYYHKHKQHINQRKQERRHLCICGANVRKNGQQKHFRTEKHINFIMGIDNKVDQTVKITCICGSTHRKRDRSHHWKSKKHINFIRENIGY
tara:strand:+ start:9 stop:581 length:573 start_codon:yes stop_codon:yes gene_type:complete